MRKWLLFLIGILFLITTPSANGYSAKTTHPALTSQVVSFYNYLHPDNPLTDQQKKWLIKGSQLEDMPPRWVNHFYDPVQGIAWNYDNMGKGDQKAIAQLVESVAVGNKTTAIDWVNNTLYQRRAEGGERTWNKAASYMADKKEKEAYITLGHVLHLLEDMAVPAHTRNDAHPPLGDLGEKAIGESGSPYESFAKGYTVENIERRTGVLEELKSGDFEIPNKTTVESYLKSMAINSNRYFFSKDTIDSDVYENPKVVEISDNLAYGLDKDGSKFPISEGVYNFDRSQELFFSGDDESIVVFQQYFKRLSKKVVLHGVALLEMFPKAVSEEVENRKYGAGNEGMYGQIGLLEEAGRDRSIVGGVSKAFNGVKNFFGSVGNVVKETFTSGNSFEESEQVSLYEEDDSEGGEVEEVIEENSFCSFDNTKIPGSTPVRINEVAWMGDNDNYRHEWIEIKNISGKELDISGYQVIDQKNQIQYQVPEGTVLGILDVYLIERSDDNAAEPEADGIYSGTLSNEDEGLQLYDKDCILRDAVYAGGGWTAGDNDEKRTMERSHDGSWHTSLEVGGTPGELNTEPKDEQEVDKVEQDDDEEESKEKEKDLEEKEQEEDKE
ncbi:MAG TPA: lamin tail domain-containing protein, partial [Candidatus Paceibacterota bacterium]|nr:lamin tail domain-containing protein [Candidatus Paceibacterota bacterium]